ncbi:unnamed protein product [Polarella glacialis]|uniref:P-type domain-containing protein n=1 Tax=Polarella glacialis TaxID=89957 RepID=A0A813HVD5_POLGL|nr:unnamed protein product [Polarella glacialis]
MVLAARSLRLQVLLLVAILGSACSIFAVWWQSALIWPGLSQEDLKQELFLKNNNDNHNNKNNNNYNNNNSNNEPNNNNNNNDLLIDAVIVAHHNDADTLLHLALPSVFRNVKQLRYVFVVGTPKLCDILRRSPDNNKINNNQINNNSGHNNNHNKKQLSEFQRNRLFVVSEEEFPFNYSGVRAERSLDKYWKHWASKNRARDWHGWTLQQLLKFYVHRALGQGSAYRPSLLPNALISDSDSVWLQATSFLYSENGSRSSHEPPSVWYSVSSLFSGAFSNDAMFGAQAASNLLVGMGAVSNSGVSCVDETSFQTCSMDAGAAQQRVDCGLANPTELQCRQHGCCWAPAPKGGPRCFVNMASKPRIEAVPDDGPSGNHFTAITHHGLFQADVVEALLSQLELQHGKEAWKILSNLRPFLCEYDLYLSWAVQRFPERIALRALPYANSGSEMIRKPWKPQRIPLPVPKLWQPPGIQTRRRDPFKSSEKPAGNPDTSLEQWEVKPTNTVPSLAYISFHDDYHPAQKCCVNAVPDASWPCDTCQAVRGAQATEKQRKGMVPQLNQCQESIFPAGNPGILEAGEQAARCRIDRFAQCVNRPRPA